MQKSYYESLDDVKYLVYEINIKDDINSINLGMLSNNNISGVADIIVLQKDYTKIFKYKIGDVITLREYLNSTTIDNIIYILEDIIKNVSGALDYMLDFYDMIWDIDKIFVNVKQKKSIVIYKVWKEENNSSDFERFFDAVYESKGFIILKDYEPWIEFLKYKAKKSILNFKDLVNIVEDIKMQINNYLTDKRKYVTENNLIENIKYHNQSEDSNDLLNINKNISCFNNEEVLKDLSINYNSAKREEYNSINKVSLKNRDIRIENENFQKVNINIEKNDNNIFSDESKQINIKNFGNDLKNIDNTNISFGKNNIISDESKFDKANISLFYLLKHYNKENAALYREQKAQRKYLKKSKKNKQIGCINNNDISVNDKVGNKCKDINDININNKKFDFVIPNTKSGNAYENIVENKGLNELNGFNPISIPNEIVQGEYMDFGETTILRNDDIEETALLDNYQENKTYLQKVFLIREKTGEKIVIDKQVFRIGKKRNITDYFIEDNTVISRKHATIINRENKFYIIDDFSTNHTFLNGERIQDGVEVQIKAGDKIRLANESFDFCIE